MNSILLSNEVIIFLFAQAILLLLLIFAFFNSISILKNWDYKKTTSLQYKLEKRSYLVILIISFTMIAKLFLMPYFAYSIDTLSNIVPGAMCAAGIISANEYGQTLLSLKVIILFFIGIWLIINSLDLKEKIYPYTRSKFWLFVFIFSLILIETFLDVIYLINISVAEPVSCCSTIFGINSTGSKIPFNLNITMLLIIFYLLYILSIVINIQKNALLNLFVNSLFLYISYYAVTYFFSTYIYELPTHQCPFCMLQHHYHYVGYIIWTSLFLGVFFAIASYALQLLTKKH